MCGSDFLIVPTHLCESLSIVGEVKYCISSSLPAQRQDELMKVLDANGASKAELGDATHVITNSPQFEGWESVSSTVAVVSDEWVDRSIIHGKMQDPAYFTSDPNMIFSGVIACSADLEPCDKEVISAGINALGGLFREGYTRDCTHLIVARPGSDKYNTALHYQSATRVHVVLPHWFDDCFKVFARLDEAPYAWPNPPIHREGQKLKKANVPEEKKALIRSAMSADETDPERLAAFAKAQSRVWNRKKILLSWTLTLQSGRRESVEIAVQRADGQIVASTEDLDDDERDDEEEKRVEEADIFITQYRFGPAYLRALQMNKTIGTLAWLFHVHKSGIVSRPQDQLLHFPIRREAVEGFSVHKVTVTNYTGAARDYLKKLVTLMDGEFTPQMTSANTIVIAAFIGGEKTDKAREWSIPIVNHTWLEDCFVAWKNLTPAIEKYIHYPEGVNFGALVAGRGVGAGPSGEDEILDIEREVAEEKEARVLRKQEAERVRLEREGGRRGQEQEQEEGTSRREEKRERERLEEEALERKRKEIERKEKELEERERLHTEKLEREQQAMVASDMETMPQESMSALAKRNKLKNTDGSKQKWSTGKGKGKDASYESENESASPEPRGSARNRREAKEAEEVEAAINYADDYEPQEYGEPDDGMSEDPFPSKPKKRTAAQPKPGPSNSPVKKLIERKEEEEEEEEEEEPRRNPSRGRQSKPAPMRILKRQVSDDDDDDEEGHISDDDIQEARPTRFTSGTSMSKSSKETRGGTSKGKAKTLESEDRNQQAPRPRGRPRKDSAQHRKLPSSDDVVEVIVKRPATVTSSKADVSSFFKDFELDSDEDLSPIGSAKRGARDSQLSTRARSTRSRTDKEADDPEAQVVTRVGPPRGLRPAKPTASSSTAGTPEKGSSSQLRKHSSLPGPTPGKVVTVEIISPPNTQKISAAKTLAKSSSLVAVSADGPSTLSSPKRGRPSGRAQSRTPLPKDESPPSSPPSPLRSARFNREESIRRSSMPTPITTSSGLQRTPSRRQAATMANLRLHEIVPDMNNFQKQMRKGEIRGSWEGVKGKGKLKTESDDDADEGGGKRRRVSGASQMVASDTEEDLQDTRDKKKRKTEPSGSKPGKKPLPRRESENIPPPGATTNAKKRARFAGSDLETEDDSQRLKKGKQPATENHDSGDELGPSEFKVMATQVKLDDSITKGLVKLGMKMVSKPTECTILITEHIGRTEKFLCAMATLHQVVTIDWAHDCVQLKKILPPYQYALNDQEGEKKFGFKLSEALERAQSSDKRLLEGHTFYVTGKVKASDKFDVYKSVASSAGGKIVFQTPTARLLKGQKNRHVISLPEDGALWRILAEEGLPVYSPEVLLVGVLTQKMDWNNKLYRLDLM